MNKFRKVAIAAAVATGVMAVGGPAVAYTQSTWAPSSNPIVAKEGGVAQAKAYGVWNLDQTSNGLRSHGDAKLFDPRPGGDGAYAEMQTQSNSGTCVSPEYTSCSQAWYFHAKDQTVRWYQDYWSTYQLATTSVDPSGSYARAIVKVCEDQSFSGDPCSGWAYSKGNKY